MSVGRLRFHLFQGFSVGGTHLSAAIYNRRIYVMRLAYREPVAVASRRSFFASSPGSGRLAFFLGWRLPGTVVPPALPPSFMEPSGSGGSNRSVDGVSSRSPVVAPSPSSLSRRVSAPSVSCPSLLVRRLGRGLGRPSRLSGRFGPVGHPSGSVVYQRQGTASCSAGAFPVPVTSPRLHSGCLLRQLHSCAFPSQGGWPLVSSPQHLGSGDLALDGVISIRLPPQFLPGSNTVLTDSLSRPHQLTHPEWSLHMTVFLFLRRLWPVQMFSLPPRPLIVVRFTSPLSGFRGQQARTRFSSSGTAFGLTRSLLWLSSAYYREAPGLHGDGTHSCDSPLGSAPLVFGPGPALAGSSSDPTVPSRPLALDSVLSSLPGSQLAQASCLAPLQRFPSAAGFSSAIAEQSSLARRPSSRAVYQVHGPFIMGGVTPMAIPFLILP